MNSYSIVGISCSGIYYAIKNINKFIYKAEKYIKGYQDNEMEFPFTILSIGIKLLFDGVCYSIQVAQVSSDNEFAVISGKNCSIFKVIDRRKKYFHLTWNGESYFIDLEKKLNTLHLTINQMTTVTIMKVDDHRQESSVIAFPIPSHVQYDEINSSLDNLLSEFTNILAGYNLPEPYFSSHLHSQLDRIFNILRNPLLPSLQFQRFLDDYGSSLPVGLVCDLRQLIGQYTLNHSSLFSRFPSNKIQSVIDNYLKNVDDISLRSSMTVILRPMIEMAEMFSDGIRGNAKFVLEKLLVDYLRVEIKFQDKETLSNNNLTINQMEIADMISHNNLVDKNKLILALFEFLEKFFPGIISDLNGTIQRLLSCLNGNLYSQLIPKLREVLITGQIPSYEVRKNEMEAIFLNSVNGYNNAFQTTRLENLICSNSEVFDIISDFFYHKMIAIRKCAMEVYVRRAYMIYEICSFEQSELANGQLCVLFKFSLPTNNNGKNVTGYELKRSNSYVALINGRSVASRKTSHTCRNTSTEMDDNSDGDILPTEDEYFQPDLDRQKSNDYDTDSAISIGGRSLSELSATVSEQVDSDGIVVDINGVSKPHHSPSTNSLDRCLPSSTQSMMRDTSTVIKRSNGSMDYCTPYRHNRHASMICNNVSNIASQDFSGYCDMGFMIIFDTLAEIKGNFSSIKDLLVNHNSSLDNMDYFDYDMSSMVADYSRPSKVILKLVLRDSELMGKCDDEVSKIFSVFCDKHLSFFVDIRVTRITFLLQSSDKTIRYFTFRVREYFEEDIKLRNIDPILSFQLEINRLRNYHLERLPVPNRMMYVYMGQCKEMNLCLTAEFRMFTRCIIHHKDFNSSTSNVEYMAKEAERNLLEAMDAFDMAWIDDRANLTKSNHIFFYFHSILCVNKIEELENVVRAIVFKHGRRLWSLRITQAELKMSVKLNNGPLIPIRLWVHNEGGKSLDICIYREEIQFKTDNKVLVSWSPSKEGRYHGVPVDCFYSI